MSIVNYVLHFADSVAGNDLYSGRALGLTQQDDYIQLHPVLKSLWKDIGNDYRRVGLNHVKGRGRVIVSNKDGGLGI
ncbi:MAG: hypothetical protein QNL87_12105 [Gammaproteobacteria bacterium]|nr:hypothetical protein [Gammaproteobacteria bacterium]